MNWFAKGVLIAAAVVAFLVLVGRFQHHQADSELVNYYCGIGAVSAAQRKGCEAHVTADDVYRLARQGDSTAQQATIGQDAADQAAQP